MYTLRGAQFPNIMVKNCGFRPAVASHRPACEEACLGIPALKMRCMAPGKLLHLSVHLFFSLYTRGRRSS